jgi:hypothetical protein
MRNQELYRFRQNAAVGKRKVGADLALIGCTGLIRDTLKGANDANSIYRRSNNYD